MRSARSQVRCAVLNGTSSAIHPASSGGDPSAGRLAPSIASACAARPQARRASLPLVGLHPDQGVDQVPDLPPPGPVTLDDQQRAAGGNVDGSLPAVLGPSRRPKTDPPTLAHRRQDPVHQQIRPAEARMLPRNVIGVHDSRAGHRRADPRRQRRLARIAAPVHCQNDRPARHDPARATPDKRPDNGSQRLDPPRPGLRLLPSKLQTHAPIMPGSPAAAGSLEGPQQRAAPHHQPAVLAEKVDGCGPKLRRHERAIVITGHRQVGRIGKRRRYVLTRVVLSPRDDQCRRPRNVDARFERLGAQRLEEQQRLFPFKPR